MTTTLVANVARPISSALSTAFNSDNVGLLANYGLLGGSTNPDAVIEALFANSEQGVWYDPSDLTTMFQDSAGTTPVTAAGQPVGLILDKSKGLVLGSELVTNGGFNTDTTGWTLGSVTASVVAGACTITNTESTFGVIYQTFATVIGKTYKATAFVNANDNVGAIFRVYTDTHVSAPVVAAGTSKDVSLIFKAVSTETIVQFVINSSTIGDFATVDNISVKELTGNHASQATAAARPLYKTDGTYSWLQFDGVDDSLSTAAINFTSTDKMSVFAGLKKNSDAGAVLLELSNNITNQGTFYLVAGEDGGARYSSLSRGTTDAALSQAAIWTPPNIAPDTAVIVTSHDIANDLSRIRRNAVYGTNGTGDKGTGNFGNYPLFIGSRAGNSVQFNGNTYSIIVRGALSTTQEITDTETWVNNKTGAF